MSDSTLDYSFSKPDYLFWLGRFLMALAVPLYLALLPAIVALGVLAGAAVLAICVVAFFMGDLLILRARNAPTFHQPSAGDLLWELLEHRAIRYGLMLIGIVLMVYLLQESTALRAR